MPCFTARRPTNLRRFGERCCAALLLPGFLVAVPMGCTHVALRKALDLDASASLNEGAIEAAASHTFPPGSAVDAVAQALPCSGPLPSHIPWYPLELFFWEANDGTIVIYSCQYYLFGIRTAYRLRLEFDNGKLARIQAHAES